MPDHAVGWVANDCVSGAVLRTLVGDLIPLKELFYFLMPDYDESGQLEAGPNGWYLPDGMALSHRPMASVHAQHA